MWLESDKQAETMELKYKRTLMRKQCVTQKRGGSTQAELETQYGKERTQTLITKCMKESLWYWDPNFVGVTELRKYVVFRDLEMTDQQSTSDSMCLQGSQELGHADALHLLDTSFDKDSAPSIPLVSEKGNESFVKATVGGDLKPKMKPKESNDKEAEEVEVLDPLTKGKAMFQKVSQHFAEVNMKKMTIQGVEDSHLVMPRLQRYINDVEQIFRHLKFLVHSKEDKLAEYKVIEDAWAKAKEWWTESGEDLLKPHLKHLGKPSNKKTAKGGKKAKAAPQTEPESSS